MPFYAMAFFPSFENQYCVRSLKLKGYKTPELARHAIERRKLEGYVKRLGSSIPVWNNIHA